MKSPLRRTLRPLLWVPATLFGIALAWTASAIPLERAYHHARTVAAVGRHSASQTLAAQNPALRPQDTLRSHNTLRPHGATAGGPATAVPLYTFTGQPDGRRAEARLIQAGGGNFYGVTEGGGNADVGDAFRMTPDGKVTQLASFGRDTTDGQYPAGPLVEGMSADGTPNGVFFGTTVQGGDSGKGTIYMLAPDAGSATGYFISYLYAFTGGTDGSTPQGGLTIGRKADGTPDGYLYGTTSGGGDNGTGVVFRMSTNGFVENRVYTFPSAASGNINQGGVGPKGALVQGHDASGWGNFFGTTSSGGSAGQGTVFSITPAGSLATIHDFLFNLDGQYPVAGLTQGAGGTLYGTTSDGGRLGYGTVYRLVADASSSTGYTYSQIVSLEADNAGPTDSLIPASDGKLYGTGSFGGAEYGGSVFSVGADTSSTTGYSATTVYTFTDSKTHGSYLHAGVTQGTDGDLYGMTSVGGSAGDGTIYRLNLGLPGIVNASAPTITSAEYHVNFNSDGSLRGGSYILVHGTGFVQSTSGLTITNLNDGTTIAKTVSDSTVVRGDLNELLPSGDHQITVTNPDGQSVTATLTTYDGPQITPPIGYQVNSDGTATVTINGINLVRGGSTTITNFTAGTTLDVNLNNKPNPVGTQITAVLSVPLPPGDHQVTVTNPDGIYTVETLTTYAAPQITPPVGYQVNSDGTATVTVNGAHFVRGGSFAFSATNLGISLDYSLNNAPNPEGTQITDQLSKPLPPGNYTVSYTNPDGQKAAYRFTVGSGVGPNITRLQSIASADGSSDLLITGTGFVDTPKVSVNNVTDGTSSSLTSFSPTALTVHLSKVLPLGFHDVTVTNPDGLAATGRLTTYGKPRVDGAAAIAQTDGRVLMVVSGVDFMPGGYNGDTTGATVTIRNAAGAIVSYRILAGPGTPANIGDPQQYTLDLGHAKNGQNYSVEVDNPDGQTSNLGALGRPASGAGRVRAHASASGSARFNVYTSNQTQYHASFIENLFKFFHLQFLLQPSGNASPTQLLPGDVNLIDRQPALLTPSGPGSILAGLVASGGGNLVASGGGNVISNDGGSIVSHDSGGIVSHDSGGIVSHDSGGLVATGGGNLISQDGGGLISQDGGGLVASGGGNVIPVSGIVAPVGASAGLGGSLNVLGLVASGGGNLRGQVQGGSATAVSFSLTRFDQGAENGTGSTDAVVIGQDDSGNDVEILRIRYTPDQPDVVLYQAPGLVLTPTNGTPVPQISNPTPTLTALTPSTAKVGSPDLTLAVTGTLFTAGVVVNWNGKPLATTILSGTQATAVVPASLLSATGTAQVTVANPAPGGGASAPLPFVVSSPLHTFPAGLQMLSVTEDYTSIGLNTALSDSTHPLVVWNPATSVYEPHMDLHPGVGYWVRLSKPTDLYDVGTPVPTSAPFPVPLQAGWNMIGDPFPTPVALTGVRVRDTFGREGTFRQAVSARVVSGTLLAYPAGATQYQEIGPNGSLTPFVGCWIYAPQPCTLLVPAH